MASAVNHPSRNPLFDRLPQKRLSPTVASGVAIAILIHAGLAAYIIHERFQIAVPEEVDVPPPFTGAILNMEKPKPKPEPTEQKEVRQTTTVIHTPADPVISDVTPLEVAPTPPVDVQPGSGPVVTLTGTPGPTTVSDAPVGPFYVKAVWSKFPDANAMMQYYPARATDAEVEGSATLACTVTDTKGRVRCDILGETPKGYGFGDAAVRAVEAKGRADTSAGAVQVGSVMKVRMGFALE
ncbi:hypothetical protein [Asticcacaulis sp. YBE204]|uniref:hypothetical protein n=1 Tax=Asticcacaulis sp. YBE204 TaxID=1282363 RepID=UPI0003C40571|nr:hypothetical protein [Asticcacaulis sp. YBE204]ESQ78037.1 hypothetical protein AEYBE204_16200 [Asticcacaulis sp. YBE204]